MPRPVPSLPRASTAAFDRRRFLRHSAMASGAALLGGPALLAACGGDDSSSSTSAPGTTAAPGTGTAPGTTASGSTSSPVGVTTAFSWVKNVEWAGWWVADDAGFFAEHGIDPDFVGGGPNAPRSMQVIEAGQAQLATASDTLQIIDAVAEGADLVMIAAVLQQSPLGLAWLDPEITTVEDLIGKRIGGSPTSPNNLDAMFAVNGLANDYEFVPIGFDPSPLTEGQVDAIMCFVTNQVITLELQGHDPKYKTLSEFGTPLYADAIFGKRSWLDENRAATVEYLRAVIKGWERNATDPAEGARLAVDVYGVDLGLDLEQSTRENERQIGLQRSDVTDAKGLLWMDPDFIAGPVYDGIRAAGRENLPDVDVLVDLSFIEEAYGGETSLLG